MKPIQILFVLGTCAATLCAAPDGDVYSGSQVVLVEVNGAKLTLSNLEQKRPAAFFQARTNYYEAERKIIEDYIDEYLLEQQAKKEDITVSELLGRHVYASVPNDPPEESLRVYYEGVETTEPYEAVRDKILDAIRQRRLAKSKAAYLQSLRSHAQVVIRLAPPRAPISMKDVPTRGPSAPQITLLEFADYECPYCLQIQPVLERIEKEFKGKLAFAYKDYPLAMHPSAPKAAEAAHCAGTQGKYWEYHDALIGNKLLDLPSLKRYARDLKLDTAAFDTCLDSGQQAGTVKSQLAEAQALGLQGTPTLFVNGRYVSGMLTYERLRGVIAEELSAIEGTAGSTPDSGVRNR